MKKVLAGLLLMPALASAGEMWGSATVSSIHLSSNHNLNEQNFGLGIEYHSSETTLYMLGAYRNSHRRTSAYALAGWTPVKLGWVKLGLLAGVANGYPKLNDGGITPVVAGLIPIEGERFGMNLILIPRALKKSPYTIGIQLKYKF
jgi:hypothetical protein